MIFLSWLSTPMSSLIMHSPISERSVAAPSRTPTQVIDKSDPSLLTKLELVERGVKYLFWGIAGMSLVAYGCMVYTQEQWKIHHRQLRKLQVQESQQAIINASLKNTQAQNAEKKQSGLVAPQPDKVLFVPATTQGAKSAPPVEVESPAALPGPVGY
jgi:hypothetical protein